MRRSHEDFTFARTSVVGIGMGTPERTRIFRRQLNLPFPILSNPERTAYGAYGLGYMKLKDEVSASKALLFTRNTLKYGARRTPLQDVRQLGGVFVVDQAGITRHAQRATASSDGLMVRDLLQTVNGLVK